MKKVILLLSFVPVFLESSQDSLGGITIYVKKKATNENLSGYEAIDQNSRAYKASVSLLEKTKSIISKKDIGRVVLLECHEDIDADRYPDLLNPLVTLCIQTSGNFEECMIYELKTDPRVNNIDLPDEENSRTNDLSFSSIIRDFASVGQSKSNEEISALPRYPIRGQSKEERTTMSDSSEGAQTSNVIVSGFPRNSDKFIEEILALPRKFSRKNETGDQEEVDFETQAKISESFEDCLKGLLLAKRNNGFDEVFFSITSNDKWAVTFSCNSNHANSVCFDLK